MTITQRIMSPTPPFFAKLRNIGVVIAAMGTAVATAPIGLPVIIMKIAGYLAVAGGVMSAVSQSATHFELTNDEIEHYE